MSIFGAPKKTRMDEKNSDEKKSIFRGDLATIGDSQYQMGRVDNTPLQYNNRYSNSDSSDSIVFLTFQQTQINGWACHECGTRNSDHYNSCVVCGLPKLEEC